MRAKGSSAETWKKANIQAHESLRSDWHSRVSLLVVFTLMYCLAVTGNASIKVLVWMNSSLHNPMYFFLWNLSFRESWHTMGVVPKSIGVMLGTSQTISFRVCILQLFLLLSLGSTECFLLSVMAYDCYLAIPYPVRYSSLMNSVLSVRLVLSSCLGHFLAIPLLALLTCRLMFCGPDVMSHFFCDIDSCLALSCSDMWPVKLATFLLSINVLVASCVVTLVYYVYILRIVSAHGQKKGLFHLLCPSQCFHDLVWLNCVSVCQVIGQNSLDLNKLMNTFQKAVTPLLNPFIYTLRNKEVKQALGWPSGKSEVASVEANRLIPSLP